MKMPVLIILGFICIYSWFPLKLYRLNPPWLIIISCIGTISLIIALIFNIIELKRNNFK